MSDAQFSWDEVYARRRVLAADVQRRLNLSFPFDVKHRFDGLPLIADQPLLTEQLLADQPLWRIPYYVIAARMDAELGRRVIDHAWWLIAADREGEPWGFVTEPYLREVEARLLVERLSPGFEDWGIELRALPASASAWFPGNTVPIVTTATVGCLREFLRLGIGAALDYLR